MSLLGKLVKYLSYKAYISLMRVRRLVVSMWLKAQNKLVKSPGAKLSVGTIIVNFLPFSGVFCPQTSINHTQMTWNTERVVLLELDRLCRNLLSLKHFCACDTLSKSNFMKIESLCAHFEAVLPPNFSKCVVNCLKFSEKLSMLSKIHDHSIICALVVLLKRANFSQTCSQISSQIYPLKVTSKEKSYATYHL